MAYIPPHKRHSKDLEGLSPTMEALIPQFKRNLNPMSSTSSVERRNSRKALPGGKNIYANDAISKWFAVGLADNTQLPLATRLEPVSLESVERKLEDKPLALVLNDHLKIENNEIRGKFSNNPWIFVAENIHQDLLSSFQNVKNAMECQKFEEVRPTLVARFGRILFHGSRSISLESVKNSSVDETTLRQLKRSFDTSVSSSFTDYITNEAVPKAGLDFEEEKEIYHIKLSDNMRPDSIISCKCCMAKDYKRMELYKIKLNQVRHLVVDMSCLDKNLDLRLMLCTKRIITGLTDDEMHAIRSLISAAVLDPDVKGGLRWPLGKESSGDRYTVVGIWHTNTKTFRNSSIRLEVRHADRFDFRTSIGEVSVEVSLKMKGIAAQLREQRVDMDLVCEMLKDNLKLIWECFLCYGSLT